jgi:ATPase subunit of ABC transporter with duplicated ATPase domains
MPAHRWRKVVRYVAAEPAWWTDTPRGAFPAERDQARLTRQLASLGLSPNLLDRPISVLSTGERLRMALARAIIDTPRVLLLDEPTASLDTASAVLVEEMIRYQMLAGRSIVLASHDLQLIARVSHERLQLGRPHAVLPRAQGANV